MKGLLHRLEQKWFVGPTDNMAGVIFPLHPEDTNSYDSEYEYYGAIGFKPEIVEFDIVKEYIDEHTNQVQSYAKLVNQYADKSNRKVKLSAYKEMAENAWEGCDGCTDSDKHFFIKGYVAALCRSEIDYSESWGKETGY